MGWSKKQFDGYRESIWDQAVALHDQTWAAINAKTISIGQLSANLNTFQTLADQMTAAYNEAKKDLGSWADSRYHDIYDFITQKIMPPLQLQLQSMQSRTSTIVSQSPIPSAGGSTTAFSSANPVSQASASSDVVPFAPFQSPTTGFQSTTEPFVTVEQIYDQNQRDQMASTGKPSLLTLGLLGGIAYVLFGRRKKVAAS